MTSCARSMQRLYKRVPPIVLPATTSRRFFPSSVPRLYARTRMSYRLSDASKQRRTSKAYFLSISCFAPFAFFFSAYAPIRCFTRILRTADRARTRGNVRRLFAYFRKHRSTTYGGRHRTIQKLSQEIRRIYGISFFPFFVSSPRSTFREISPPRPL